MKVLIQKWENLNGGPTVSVSINRQHLDTTIRDLNPERPRKEGDEDDDGDGDFLERNEARPDEEAQEIEIPDDSTLAAMVQRNTTFLYDDEMDVIWESNPDLVL